MREITFSEAEVQAIGWERYQHPEPRVQRHMEVLWLKHHGLGHERIATLADCSRSTVQRTLSAYAQGGLERIRQAPAKESSSELDIHRVGLEQLFKDHPPRSVKEARLLFRSPPSATSCTAWA